MNPPLRILIIDDSKVMHTLIKKAFKEYNVDLFFAVDGAKGFEAAQEHPDLILLDVAMPIMDGIETLGKLKADPSLKSIPVIMFTSEVNKEAVVKIARLGVRDYIVKPFSEELMIERIGRVIDLQRKA